MPTYVSKGFWYPAKEYVVDPNAPKGKEIYEGPDRAALEQMAEAGLYDLKTGEFKGYFGSDIRSNIDVLQLARTLGYKDVEEYLTHMHGWTPEKFEEHFKKNSENVLADHKDNPKKDGVKEVGGGYDKTGNRATRYGGMGLPDDVPSKTISGGTVRR